MPQKSRPCGSSNALAGRANLDLEAIWKRLACGRPSRVKGGPGGISMEYVRVIQHERAESAEGVWEASWPRRGQALSARVACTYSSQHRRLDLDPNLAAIWPQCVPVRMRLPAFDQLAKKVAGSRNFVPNFGETRFRISGLAAADYQSAPTKAWYRVAVWFKFRIGGSCGEMRAAVYHAGGGGLTEFIWFTVTVCT
ncbi:hypothetical protein B0H17DRAFT_1133462 [Mycena rosella]|uniref:Uncharacterized protein n=1 Tax=Mycena rosella TaxID=1033263 RepID=A0AAD7DJX0_MYCRO|nr:hypothetical protein B0H17DRAFT_1133462 [Mycena rosella]